ncbi:MAG TPA: HEAT repeat domain-containing protein [Gemmataceae bacterium]|nr:HEAT repeat domain-containing protein [Gemmataceae bacterium]
MMRGMRVFLPAVVGAVFLAPAAPAADAEAIHKAIQRGIVALQRLQQADGTWPYPEIGATALAGLTLLECDVPAKDPAVQKAAAAVRRAALRESRTYSLALSIMFLDRLGEPTDVPFIEIMGVRLLAGQKAAGGWTYQCVDAVEEADLRRLEAHVKQRTEQPPVSAKEAPEKPGRELPREVQLYLAYLLRAAVADTSGDNSNTQFAVLGLWVARRYGVPIEQAAVRLEQRFRTSQGADGGWGYGYSERGEGDSSTPAMTCAALLGLAVSQGAVKGRIPRDLAKDPAFRAGLVALGTAIDHPAARRPGNPRVPTVDNGRFYYFLWSLERLAVICGLETIGGKDWYNWGAEILLANQGKDGSWQGEYGSYGADTCFALLFLKRSNPARDLTAVLKGIVQDPGEVVLRAGGVSGAGLQPSPRLPSPLEPLRPGDRSSSVGQPKEGSSSLPAKPSTPSAGVDDEVGRLTARLAEARGRRLDELLAQMKEAKGVAYTQALAAAIPRLSGTDRDKAREALAERLARMSSATLADKLQDDDLEVRRAAALAVAMKDDKSHLRKLIDLLEDPEPPVARAAHTALRSLTGQDFGPAPDASRAERARAVAAWKEWWNKRGGK